MFGRGVFMSDEKTKRIRGSKDGKYDLIVYLLDEWDKSEMTPEEKVEKIINMTPEEALKIFPADNKQVADALRSYVSRNHKRIKALKEGQTQKYFFPGRNDNGSSSPTSLLHELHFHLQKLDPPVSLSRYGLSIRMYKQNTEMKKTKANDNIIDWATEMLKD